MLSIWPAAVEVLQGQEKLEPPADGSRQTLLDACNPSNARKGLISKKRTQTSRTRFLRMTLKNRGHWRLQVYIYIYIHCLVAGVELAHFPCTQAHEYSSCLNEQLLANCREAAHISGLSFGHQHGESGHGKVKSGQAFTNEDLRLFDKQKLALVLEARKQWLYFGA